MPSEKKMRARAPMAIVLLCISFVILIWAGLLYDSKRSEDIALQQGRKDVSNLAVAFRENITGIVSAIDQLTIGIAADHARHPDDYSIPEWVKTSPLLQGLALQVGLMGRDGIVRASNLPFHGRVDISGRPHFRYHLDPSASQPYISVPVIGRVSGKWSVQVTRRLTRDDGQFDGVVVVSIDPFYLSKFFDNVDLGKGGNALLVGRDGIVRARRALDNQGLGQDLSNSELLQNVQTASEGTFIRVGKLNGVQSVFGYASLQAYPLVVDVAMPTDEILAPVRHQNTTRFIIGGTATLALMALAWLLVRDAKRRRQQELAQFAHSLVQEQKARLDAALENMSQGLVMFDSSNRLVVCNRRYLKMYGLSPEAVRAGCALEEILDCRIAAGHFLPDDREQYLADILTARAKNTIFSKLTNLPDGRFIQIVNHPVADGGWVATHDDVTEIRHREESFRLLFENNPVPMWVYDCESLRFLSVNKAAVKQYGYSHEQFLAMTIMNIRPPEARERLAQFKREHFNTKRSEQLWQHQKSDGTKIDVFIYSQLLTYEGHAAHFVAAIDITERKQAEDKLRRTQKFLDTVIENVPVPIMVKDVSSSSKNASQCRYSLINRACEELFGVSRTKIIGKTIDEIYPKERAHFIIVENDKTLQSHQAIALPDHEIHTLNNGVRLVTAKSIAVRDDDGNAELLLTVLDDVTERRRTEQRIAHMAHYDALTDLPNRVTFQDTLDATIERVATTGEEFAVLSLDFDHFKEANDTYGHVVGDELLIEIARRLKVAAGATFLARLGGDEFVLVGVNGTQPAAAAALAERLLATLADDFEVEGHRLKLGMSIGIANYPTDGIDAKTLMINADAALYRAKAETRGMAMFFEPEMGVRLHERYALQEDLRLGINRGELRLHYQPQVKMSGEAVGFEALARWQCPKRGMVPPGTFIPIAEESSLILSLGEWVLREACREAASWPQPLTIAVNISPIQFRHGDLPRLIHSILLETGLAPARLELEITESVMINDFSRAVSILNQLKSLGVKIAMDDFGTGYSSLSYLQSFRCDKIKIDRIFICDLEDNFHSRSIVRAVISLGRSLDLPILAEGVETEAQHAFLVQEGCDEVQGYLTGRPLPIADYAELVGRQAGAQKIHAVAG